MMDRDLTKEHFERQWSNTFYPPKDVQFSIYSERIWAFAKGLIKNSKAVVDLGAGGDLAIQCSKNYKSEGEKGDRLLFL